MRPPRLAPAPATWTGPRAVDRRSSRATHRAAVAWASLSLFLPCESNVVSLHLLAWSSQTFLALILHWLVGKSVNKWGKHWWRLVSNCKEFFGL